MKNSFAILGRTPVIAMSAFLLSCSTGESRPAPVDGAPAEVAPASAPAAAPFMVEMNRSDQFYPDVLVIRPGDTVEWINNSDRIHSVTNDPASAIRRDNVSGPPHAAPFDSGYLSPGKTFRVRFTQEGEYRYTCFLHEVQGMTGRILVIAKGAP